MCKSQAEPTAVVVNHLEGTSLEFHGPTLLQSILVTGGILLFIILLVICCKHYGMCSIAERASRRHELGRLTEVQHGGSYPIVQPAPQVQMVPLQTSAYRHVTPTAPQLQVGQQQAADFSSVIPPRDQFNK